VPAESAEIGPVDRIFTRIGAADDLAGGRSTFMVEMTEAANILNNANARQLVLMDEIGRGHQHLRRTVARLGLCRHIGREVGAFTLFATHYFELTALADELARLCQRPSRCDRARRPARVPARGQGSPANQSYGLQVARLAGVPRNVIQDARRYLAELERRDHASRPDTAQQTLDSAQPWTARAQDVLESLGRIDPDAVSPRDALALLFDLQAGWRAGLEQARLPFRAPWTTLALLWPTWADVSMIAAR